MVWQALLGDGRQTRPRARAWTGGDAPTRDGGRADEVSAGDKLDAFVTASHGGICGTAASVDGTSTEGNEPVEAWDSSCKILMNAVELSFRRPDDCCRVLTFPDASDLFWGCCLAQAPEEELVAGLSFMDMSQEPLAFLSRVFRGSQLCRPTVDQESFAILSDF